MKEAQVEPLSQGERAAGYLFTDVLNCPRCHGQLKIIAFITQLAVVQQILAHGPIFRPRRPPRTVDHLLSRRQLCKPGPASNRANLDTSTRPRPAKLSVLRVQAAIRQFISPIVSILTYRPFGSLFHLSSYLDLSSIRQFISPIVRLS